MVYVFIAVVGLLLFIYMLQVNEWRTYWVNEKEYTFDKSADIGISVIIPFKDEEANLNRLLNSLKEQNHGKWELILVNDHSTDNGLDLIKSRDRRFPVALKVLNSPGKGKKRALLHGAQHAAFDTIITSDADCVFHCGWLRSMAACRCSTQADLIIGPVAIEEHPGLLSRFQEIDFAALQLSGAAATIKRQAIMCNGANLLCDKALYLQARFNHHIASGDDMFLLEWMKENNKKVSFLKSGEAVVLTFPAKNIRSFLMQRARWAAKAPAYRDKHILLSGLLVSTLSFAMTGAFIGGLWHPPLLYVFALTLLLKSLSDYALLYQGKRFFKYRLSFLEVILIQLLYPFYVLSVLLFPLFVKLKWKERII